MLGFFVKIPVISSAINISIKTPAVSLFEDNENNNPRKRGMLLVRFLVFELFIGIDFISIKLFFPLVAFTRFFSV